MRRRARTSAMRGPGAGPCPGRWRARPTRAARRAGTRRPAPIVAKWCPSRRDQDRGVSHTVWTDPSRDTARRRPMSSREAAVSGTERPRRGTTAWLTRPDRRTGNRRTRPSAAPRTSASPRARSRAGCAPARRTRGASSLAWVGIIAVLIVLVATVGGGLKDEFEIPGSDTQKATDLIESEFASEQGGVLNLVFAAPTGERLDTPERKAAIEERDREAQDRGVQADRGQGGHRERRRPVRREHVLRRRAYRLRGGAVRPGDLRRGSRGRRRGAGRRARGGRAGRRHGRVQRRRRVPADRAGHAGAARPARGAHRAARRLPHVRRDDDPDRARDRGAR